MRKPKALLLAAVCVMTVSGVDAQIYMSGRVKTTVHSGSAELSYIGAMFTYASLDGEMKETLGHRTWETEPGGWYRMTGSAGRYTLLYSNPGEGWRPKIITNVFTEPGDNFDVSPQPVMDFQMLKMDAWDKRAHAYYQPFTAKSKSITHACFRLAHDGVDGQDYGGQNMLLSVHEISSDAPETWKQIGPEVVVLHVDTGGVKNYLYGAGWNSGEVPVTPGKQYAIRLAAEKKDGTFQPFWTKAATGKGAYRLGGVEGSVDGWTGNDIWMSVSGDSDGLLIPYNKRVLKQYTGYTNYAKRWSQTYVAQGKSLASVIMYSAWAGTQPGLFRQRAVVRVREGGAEGRVVGVQKVAIGNGMHTGDASWGAWGVAYSPGEVPLTSGKTYALEFESLENIESLHDYVDIKDHPTNTNPGFTPIPKVAPDDYKRGRAYKEGVATDWDLDMQIVEYEAEHPGWVMATTGRNLVLNGKMDRGETGKDTAENWTPFRVDPNTELQYIADQHDNNNRLLRVRGQGTLRRVHGGPEGQSADGGFVQKVEGLTKNQTYRLTGRVRCSWPVDEKRWMQVGFDPTGQVTDTNAASIRWTNLPPIHSIWTDYQSGTIRPTDKSVSVWLRARTPEKGGYPFTADFDDFELKQVATDIATDSK